MSIKAATLWSIFWILCACIFGAGVWYYKGADIGSQFFAAYIVEKSLSVDNLFVFYMVFAHFNIKGKQQRKILNYGILGAIVMRGALLAGGVTLVQEFNWLLYVFGAFLILTGLKMLLTKEGDEDISNSRIVRFFSRRKIGTFWIVLCVIELMDLVFAIDSIPAVLSVSQDLFVVYTSNIFAILGLRSLYFLLAALTDKLHYLKHGISLVLVFIGGKMLAQEYYHMPTTHSLTIVGLILGVALMASLCRDSRKGLAAGK